MCMATGMCIICFHRNEVSKHKCEKEKKKKANIAPNVKRINIAWTLCVCSIQIHVQ